MYKVFKGNNDIININANTASFDNLKFILDKVTRMVIIEFVLFKIQKKSKFR